MKKLYLILFACYLCAFPATQLQALDSRNRSAEISRLHTIKWVATEVNGYSLTERKNPPYLIFASDNPSFSGYTGCNMMGGTYMIKENSQIRFQDIHSTMMACVEGMELEREVTEMLSHVTHYAVTPNQLTLFNSANRPQARFEASSSD